MKKDVEIIYNSSKLLGFKKKIKSKQNFFLKKILFIAALIILVIKIYKEKNNTKLNEKEIISEPIVPKKMYKKLETKFESSEFKYNFRKKYENRKIFKYNYSYLPYRNMDKSISKKENAEKIFESTGILNFTMLEYYYNNIALYTSNLNDIHVGFGLDPNYIPITLVGIISILETANKDTYIHFHIIGYNFTFDDMEKFMKMKEINKNIDFIFYSTKQSEYDFEAKIKGKTVNIVEYSRLLLPHIVNGTDKLLSLDSGDILIQKDLTELFYLDLEDNYFAWAIDMNSGRSDGDPYMINHLYGNAGIILINCTLYRNEEFYMKAYFTSYFTASLIFPYQDLLSILPFYKIKILPLKYNCKLFFDNDEQMKNKDSRTSYIQAFLNKQSGNSVRYSLEEVMEAALDPVIFHYYGLTKIYTISSCNKYIYQFIKYSKLTGFFEIIKKKYPKPFQNCDH